MDKKDRQRVKKASKLLVSALILGALSLTSNVIAADVTTWSEYQTAINGSDATINVNNNITYEGTTENIARTLSIIGNATDRFLSGNDAYKGLTVDTGSNLTLQNITMQNFKTMADGGAIYNEGNLIINGSTFTGNYADNSTDLVGKGGAIYNAGTLTFTGTNTFSGNNAREYGGAIYNHMSGSINSLTGDFISNSANGGGGAIYNDGTIDSITGDFTENSATYGGAIYNSMSSSSRIGSITGDFIENSAQEDGGAIFNRMSNTINSITGDFTENSAKNGGAIHNAGSIGSLADIGINNSTFTGNTATDNGGAIYNNGEIYIKDSTFTGNAAKTGGAIYNTNGAKTNIIADDRDITFNGNYLTSEFGQSGAIYNDQGTVGLYADDGKTITFAGGANDTTNNKYGIDGIMNDDILNINGDDTGTTYTGTVNLYTVNTENNTGETNIYGGTVGIKDYFEQGTLDVKNGATLDLAKGQINQVIADTLNIADGAKLRFDVDNTQNDKFTANNIYLTSGDKGIIIDYINMMGDIDSGTITLFDSTDTSALSGKITGINTYYNKNFYEFTQNDTEYGKLNVVKTEANWTIQDVIAAQTGDKIINTYSMATDENLTLPLGTLTPYSGESSRTLTIIGNGHALNGQNNVAGITIQSGLTLNLNDVVMKNFYKINGDKSGGGSAIFNNGGTITNISGDFVSNRSDGNQNHGGAIFNKGIIESITGNFESNWVKAGGGAIANGLNGSPVYRIGKISANYFKNNSGSYGGAIYNGSNSEIGTIACDEEGTTLLFESNSAGTTGGAIYNWNAKIDSIEANFKSNIAGTQGGAIYNLIENSQQSSIIGSIKGNFEENSAVYGGAIYNAGTIGNSTDITKSGFTSDFVSNSADFGGAIYNNTGTINNISGKFTGNQARINGGAIYNYAAFGNSSVGNITGNFTSNSVNGYAGNGGAIYNYANSNHTGSIGNITGDFTSNSASLDHNGGGGGAIYNYAYDNNARANIGNIIGNFTSNSVGSEGAGGAIYNFATLSAIGSIGNITGDFISNSAGSSGGAICNYARGEGQATLSILATNNKDVTFNGNFVTSSSGKGGAIYNESSDAIATIGLYADTNRTITFVGGADEAGKYDIDGIYNTGTLNINGNGTDTYTGTVNLYKVSDAHPTDPTQFEGTINIYDGTVNVKDTLVQKTLNLNGGTLNLGRNASVYDFNVIDGAKLSLSIPDGTFENYENEINTLDVSNDFSGVLSDFTVDYDATAAEGSNIDKIVTTGGNGAIRLAGVNVIKDGDTMNDGTFLTGTLDSIEDNTTTTSTTTSGGWKYTFTPSSKGVVTVTRAAASETLAQVIQNATGSSSFSINTNPYTTNENLGALAGVGRNFTISGNGNTLNGNGHEGITVNDGQTLSVENTVVTGFNTQGGDGKGAFITLKQGSTVNNLTGNYTSNSSDDHAGVIFNHGNINNISATFSNNTAGANGDGGAINNNGSITESIINSVFENNQAGNLGGAIANYAATINNIENTLFTGNTSGSSGGAIRNSANSNIVSLEASFKNNTSGANGGAIFNENSDINIIAKNNSINFENNSATGLGGAIYNNGGYVTIQAQNNDVNFVGNNDADNAGAIYNENNSNLTLTANAGKSINFKNESDKIVNDGTMKVNVNSIGVATNGTINLQAVDGIGTTDIYGGTVSFGADYRQANTNIYGGNLNLINNKINIINFGNLNLTSDANLMLDADLANGDIDQLTCSSLSGDGMLYITGINIMSDLPNEVLSLETQFVGENLMDHIILNVDEVGKGVSNPYQTTAYSPIYKYDVTYRTYQEGEFEPSASAGGYLSFEKTGELNPSILAGSVAAQMGGYLNLIQTYENAFEHMDTYMLMTSQERLAMKMRNRYAAAGTDSNLITYSPNQTPEAQRGMWVKPFASFEKVNLNNGPRVENIGYGTFIGGDSDLIELSHGWDAVFSGHVSYNGSHQNYDGVSIYQNGGTLGGTATFYKNNFFTGLTANVGASVAEASTMYGQDNMTMLLAGIASKTGYNWELAKGRFTIQPSMLISYSFVNTFDFKNAAGVNVHSNPLNAIQLAPGLKFIVNLPHGWQPYIGLQMVWNIMDDSKIKANDIWLPETSVDPYFQYGVGVQKRWGERFNGFFQTMIRNGGRTGVALSAGFRWAIGQNGTHTTSHKTPELKKTKINIKSAS